MSAGVQAPNAWRVLAVLFLANLLNFFDRVVPAIVLEPIRKEWNLDDMQLGIVAAAFTVGLVLAGIPLGRLADTMSRSVIMGWGLVAWSAFTALGAAAPTFGAFLLTRFAVGIGEASYSPAATSLIGDLFPSERRSRAMGVFTLGLPMGLLLAFLGVGALVSYTDSWRLPFVIALIPGLVVSILLFRIREPARGAAEANPARHANVARPIRTVLGITTMRWIIVAAIVGNFAAYATNIFAVPLLQRYFGLSIGYAALATGIIVGMTGLVGLTIGGVIADRLHQRLEKGRLLFGSGCVAMAAIATGCALHFFDGSQAVGFTIVFSVGWLLQYAYYITIYPAMQDVVEPRLRATATAILMVVLSLLGGALGPIVTGHVSDRLASVAMTAAGAPEMTDAFRATGLHGAFWLVPVCLLLTAIAMLLAARSFPECRRAMERRMAALPAGAQAQ